MQREKLFLVLSVMALATGCSNDETIKVNEGDRIDFSVTAGKLTRATAITTSSINEFKVWAFTGTPTQLYMNGIEVNKENDKWTYSGTKFWPETPVDFFAVSPVAPKSGTVTVNTIDRKIESYVANGKEDLLYAMNKEEEKEDYKNIPVNINFRHALSQIVFKVKNTNSSIEVEVKSIKVKGVANQSSLTWATETTGFNLPEGNADTETGNTWGVWEAPIGEAEYTAVDLGDASYTVTSEANFLTSDAGNGALFLMPQTLKPWLTIAADKTVEITGTARLLVNCKITDITSGIVLWPNNSEDYGEVAISLNNPNSDPKKTEADPHERWMQGKKYIYTLIFGEGGGYNPKPNPDDPNKPEPVLVPITFDVTVDNFQDGGECELNPNNPQ